MLRSATLRGAAACLAATLLCATAEAQLFRAYLAADGNDANPCTLQAPCRLLPAALNAVASGGEIWMLDSANYNTSTVAISKSVSILAVPGVVGSVVALNGGPAISIDDTGLTVALRNLVIGPVAGAAEGTQAVYVNGASHIAIEDTLIAGHVSDAVVVLGGATLMVANSTLRDNVGFAIYLVNGATAAIFGTKLLSNGGGVSAWSPTTVTTTASISDSVISGKSPSSTSVYGVRALSQNGGLSRISVTRSTIERTTWALRSRTGTTGTAEVNVGVSLIVDSDFAWHLEGAGSSVLSLGSNQMSGNGGSVGVLTSLPPQ